MVRKRVRKGDVVMVKLGTNIGWRKAKVVKRVGRNVTITGVWSEGVKGTINERFVRFIKNKHTRGRRK